MPINPSIPLSVANIPPVQIPMRESPVQSLTAIAPGINAMRQLEAQRTETVEKQQQREALQQMRQGLMSAGKSGDLGMYSQALIGSGDARLMEMGARIQQALMEESRSAQALKPFQGQPVTRESVQNMMLQGGVAGRTAGDLARTLPAEPKEQQDLINVGGALYQQSTGKFLQPPQQQQAAGTQARRYISTPDGVFDTETQQYIPRPAGAGTAAGAPSAAAMPPAKPMTPEQQAKRRDLLGKEYKSAVSALQVTQDVLDSARSVKESPGLSRATGLGSVLPSFPGGEAAFADVRLQNLKGKITALGKAQAASTGAIGSIANQEWKILADQIAAIEAIKGAGPMLEQIDLLEAQAVGAMNRIRDAYERQFGEDFERFPQFGDLPKPTSAFKGRGAATQAPAAQPPSASPAQPAQAPIYARNPQTGARIMSTDGGQTWSPVR
jgi:hypothetical protein